MWRNIGEKDLLKVALKESVLKVRLVVLQEVDRLLQKTKAIFLLRLVVVLV